MTVQKKEIDRWKEEVRVQESKACVATSRHKAEVDAHRDTREQLDKTIKHLSETRGEIETTRKECQEFMDKFKTDEESKVKREEVTQLEQSAKLIIDQAAASELGTLREKYNKLIEENNTLSVKIQKIETERLESDEQIGKLKESLAQFKQENVDLLAQVAEMESLRLQLQRSEEKVAAQTAESERLKEEAKELNEDMSACRKKEAELLEFTQKLTDKNVTLQSDLAALEAKFSVLETEHSRLAGKIGELESAGSQTNIELGMIQEVFMHISFHSEINYLLQARRERKDQQKPRSWSRSSRRRRSRSRRSPNRPWTRRTRSRCSSGRTPRSSAN